ncbi:MAG: hypothetical protein HY222_01860 [Thaumarchaeota archaeon]|nr:hypothetical protein [Nitrososphaerota archaeon]MBI3641118.1 hypothetical protein [Nitrososphaerota archaeon]
MKYTKLSYQPKQAENIQITGVKGKLNVKGKNSPQFEIGVAEQEQSSNVRLGDMVILYLTLRLTPYLLNRIEEFRSGGDLWFNFEPLPSGLTVAYQDVSNNVDLINFQASGNTMWKYPKSEWIDQLNTTEFNKIELIEIPIIELPEIPLTEEVMKFVSQATKAMNEGRYGDVLFECRKVIDALDKGIEEWGKNTTLNAEEKLKLEDIKSKSNGKRIGKREEELSKLMADVEKGVRLGMVIGNLHYYLSLNPHEAEHKSNFTVDDAKFVIHSITSYARNILKYIENKQA